MKVVKGKVVSGKVVVEGSLPEGATVTVLAPEGDLFTLTPDEEAALLTAISEADRGEVDDAAALYRRVLELNPHHRQARDRLVQINQIGKP